MTSLRSCDRTASTNWPQKQQYLLRALTIDMASDNDEEDYMSLKFLEEPEDQKNKELSYVEKRKKALREQEKKAYIKPRRVLEEEARQEGMKKELDDKNKGMKMLMKMGFKYAAPSTFSLD